MGRDKSLLLYQGDTLLDRALDLLTQHFAEVLVVGGREPALATRPGLSCVPDVFVGCGPLSGIHAALSAASGRPVFVMGCDMPLVTGELVARIVAAREPEADAVCSRCLDCGTIEPLFAVWEHSSLPSAEGQLERRDFRLRHWLDRLRVRWLDLDEAAHRLLSNVNTPEDLDALLRCA